LPHTHAAAFHRDAEKRLRLAGALEELASGPYWFRAVTGRTPDGRKTLVIWRRLTGDLERDNLVLDAWFTKQGYAHADAGFELVYVNGTTNLEDLKSPESRWKVRLIEEDFHRLMFDGERL
jgi:adenine-specific DNA-methyltransferase